jgi:predicted secreted Zn-dependent protease
MARRTMLGAAIAVGAMVVEAAPLPLGDAAGFQVIRRETTLTISAENRQALSQALSDLYRTQGWHGQTAMSFEQTTELVSGASGCRIEGLRTTLEVTVTLPRLEPGDARDARDLARLWGMSLSALRAHEEGHVSIGIEGAKASHERLAALGPFASCRDARRALIREEFRFRHRQALLHERYDRRTDFGRRTGRSPRTR